MMLDPKVVLAISKFTQYFGEILGALEATAASSPDSTSRRLISDFVSTIIELDPVENFVKTLVEVASSGQDQVSCADSAQQITQTADGPHRLDAEVLERLRKTYAADEEPACWLCGGPMAATGYSPGLRVYRWHCTRDGAIQERDAGDPDVVALVDAYVALCGTRTAL